MADEGKKYVVHGMYAQCSMGTMKNYLNTDVGHGVIYQGQPLLNANDHTPQINLTHFGDCNSKMIYVEAKKQADEKYKAEAGDGFLARAGKAVAKNAIKAAVTLQGCLGTNKCQLDTPLPWRFCNEEHMIDGAPALTVGSVCPCRFGGIISVIETPDQGADTSGQTAEETAAQAADAAIQAAETMKKAAREAEYADTMSACYGFDKTQALLIQKAYDLSKSKKGSVHDFSANMAAFVYGGSLMFGIVDGIPSAESAQNYFKDAGMGEQEVRDLADAVSKQHRGSFNAKAREEKDFAHEMAIYAGYFNDKSYIRQSVLDQWDKKMVLGDMNTLNSYKGDIYSASMGIDDMNTDMDALNVYNAYMQDEQQDFFEVMTGYNKGVASKDVNRAKVFLGNFKGKDEDEKFERLKKELGSVKLGEWFLAKDKDPKDVEDTKDAFIEYIDKVRKEGDKESPVTAAPAGKR